MTLLAGPIGYLIGSIPTANWLGRMWGVDLTRGGTGNPGANNARRLGGYRLALLVLCVEMAKGFFAVAVGSMIAGDTGALAAGLGAVAGNVYNVWYRFRGGKGLGITGGVLIGLWPAGFPFVVLVLILASAVTRSTGSGTLLTLLVLVAGSPLWDQTGLDNPWGLVDTSLLVPLAIGLAVVISPKHWRDARARLSSPVPP